MKKSNINISLIKKILFVLLAAIIIELGVFNFSYWTLMFNSDLITNRVYTLNDMEIANWERQDAALVSQVDPMLVIPGVDLMLKNVQIEADLSKSVPYITLFYTNEQYQNFNGEAMIEQNQIFKDDTLIQVDKEVSNLRIDLGDDPGVTLKEIKVTVNPLELNFSLSRVIAMVGIYFGAVFLFLCRKTLITVYRSTKMDHHFSEIYQRVKLEPLTQDDTEQVRLLRNLNRKWFVFSEEISPESQKKWYEEYLTRNNDVMFSVRLQTNNAWIGTVALYAIDRESQEAEFGRLLIGFEGNEKKGLGLDTTICACKIGFEQMELSRIRLEVFTDNVAAYKTYERAGFYTTGIYTAATGREMFLMELTKKNYDNNTR